MAVSDSHDQFDAIQQRVDYVTRDWRQGDVLRHGELSRRHGMAETRS